MWLYGVVVGTSSSADFVPVNGADDWLHLVLAVGMILLAPGARRVGASADRV